MDKEKNAKESAVGSVDMEKIVSLCKRRGFIFQGSEIYGGLAGTWDFGHFGVALKNNIKNSWWKKFVESRTDMYGVDAAILMNSKVWEASGHVDGFHDPMIEDLKTKKRYRADHVLEASGQSAESFGSMTKEELNSKFQTLASEGVLKAPDGSTLKEVGEVRQFNMMFATQAGAMEDSSSTVYLRPETAQGMFVNFKNTVDAFHPKLPFGTAQIGKAFRNEITPRDFIFRQREFEQMEIEYFIREEDWEKHFEYWRKEMSEWIDFVGIDMTRVHEVDIPEEDRAHYSKRTIDFEFEYPFGQKELFGLAYRTDYDLKKHGIEYVDEERGGKMTPHVIEPSFGLDRAILALLVSAYTEEGEGDKKRVFLKFKPSIAPMVCAVSPLLKNKPELVEYAKSKVFAPLKQEFGRVMWDDNGNVGKRYRRQDEIGTPFCIVVDFDTLGEENPELKDTVTVRDRDTGEQERVKVSELVNFLKEKLED